VSDYKWESPFDWLVDKMHEWSPERIAYTLRQVAAMVSSDDLQDLLQVEMDADGYFDKQEGGRHG